MPPVHLRRRSLRRNGVKISTPSFAPVNTVPLMVERLTKRPARWAANAVFSTQVLFRCTTTCCARRAKPFHHVGGIACSFDVSRRSYDVRSRRMSACDKGCSFARFIYAKFKTVCSGMNKECDRRSVWQVIAHSLRGFGSSVISYSSSTSLTVVTT